MSIIFVEKDSWSQSLGEEGFPSTIVRDDEDSSSVDIIEDVP